jgi:hypothetical protein
VARDVLANNSIGKETYLATFLMMSPGPTVLGTTSEYNAAHTSPTVIEKIPHIAFGVA